MNAARRLMRSKKAPGLMLTSLLDMFTIILIFLIVSYDAEAYDFRVAAALTLPESSSRTDLRPGVNLAVTSSNVMLGDVAVLPIESGEIPASAIEGDVIPALVRVLEEEHNRRYGENGTERATLTDETPEPMIIVQADAALPYRSLYLVLRSAASAGFTKYRMATMRTG